MATVVKLTCAPSVTLNKPAEKIESKKAAHALKVAVVVLEHKSALVNTLAIIVLPE
jgi:hypothetical protein